MRLYQSLNKESMNDGTSGCCQDKTGAGADRCGGCGGSCGGVCGHHGFYKKGAVKVLAFSLSLLALAMVVTEVKGWKTIGLPEPQVATITVSGDGEEYGKPDIAVVSFSVVAEGKTVADAQKKAADSMNAVLAYLKGAQVADTDVKTTGYNFYPKYEWQEGKQVQCFAYPCPPVGGKQILVGYEVSQSVDVKIRDLDKAGDILGGLGEKGATNLSGLSFMVEHPDDLKAAARKEAIAKAQEKAKALAADLGVRIVRLASYGEGGDYPVFNYARADGGMAAPTAKADISLPMGENKYVSNVTLVYEVK